MFSWVSVFFLWVSEYVKRVKCPIIFILLYINAWKAVHWISGKHCCLAWIGLGFQISPSVACSQLKDMQRLYSNEHGVIGHCCQPLLWWMNTCLNIYVFLCIHLVQKMNKSKKSNRKEPNSIGEQMPLSRFTYMACSLLITLCVVGYPEESRLII